MTRNQIEYWRLQETERSNRVNEQHNRNVLAYNYQVLAETRRSNLAREAETRRSNIAREKQNLLDSNRNFELQKRSQEETQRHNRAVEQLNAQAQLETTRSNKAREQLQAQANAIQASSMTLKSNELNETVRRNKANEQLEMSRQVEQRRSDKQNELLNQLRLGEIRRSNLATEAEKRRSNMATERINFGNLEVRRSELSERTRSNLANERIQIQHYTVSDTANLLRVVRGDLNEAGKQSSKFGTQLIKTAAGQ